MKSTCGVCGTDRPEGYAYINDVRYCHGDFPGTCYERAIWQAETEYMNDYFEGLE